MNLVPLVFLGAAYCSPNIAVEDGLKFVFEINRHGARGPMHLPGDSGFGEGFQFGVSNLTPNGMRMRQILGKMSRQKYLTGDVPFLNSSDLHKELYVESTDVLRTI